MKLTQKDLLEAGVHFGHLKKKWNPKMAPYIFMEKRGIHLIDLNKSLEKLEEAANAMRSIARAGKKILFVATKKQAKAIVAEAAQKTNMPYVTERWLGGMLTNFSTIRKSIKKMQTIDSMLNDKNFESIAKRERLQLSREREKLGRVLGGIEGLNRMPAAIYIVDISKESIALDEALKLNISTFALADTNVDPTMVDFPIPANDDANKSIAIITEYLVEAISEGLAERAKDKKSQEAEKGENTDADAEGGDEPAKKERKKTQVKVASVKEGDDKPEASDDKEAKADKKAKAE